MTKLPYRTARSVIQRNGMPFFTIQWTEIRLYMVEIIVIVNRMNEIFDIEFAIFFGSADVWNVQLMVNRLIQMCAAKTTCRKNEK